MIRSRRNHLDTCPGSFLREEKSGGLALLRAQPNELFDAIGGNVNCKDEGGRMN
jgi:hypothetical protein